MGIFADRLNSMVVSLSSPDGQVEGRLRGRNGELDVSFPGDGYRGYTERGLEHQLSHLLTSLWTNHRRGRDAALAEAVGRPVEKREPWDANQRRFDAEHAVSVAEGMSEAACVFTRSTAMESWEVVIRDGTLAKLDEPGFVRELIGAYRALTTDYHVKMSRLRVKHFGVDII